MAQTQARRGEIVSQRRLLRKNAVRFALSALLTLGLILLCLSLTARAAPSVTIDLGGVDDAEAGNYGVLDLLLTVTLLALAPSILIMMTSFTRIIIVLSFLRNALATQQSPPNQVLIGLALFLTLFIMQPVIEQIDSQAWRPYKAGELTQAEALQIAEVPIKEFMLRQIYTDDLRMFLSISGQERPLPDADSLSELELTVVVPAFVTSELKRAFIIGFLLFIPFLIIDMVVASTLMSMGMVMLPPSMIALPFKIMMFVVVDGWGLLIENLVRGFQ